MVLEQVYQAVPGTVYGWLMCNGPTSLDQAVAQLENYFLAEWASKPETLPPEIAGLRKGLKGNMDESPKGLRPNQSPSGPPTHRKTHTTYPLGGWEVLPSTRPPPGPDE